MANDDDDWTVLTAAGETTDLSESVLSTSGSGNGGDLVGTNGTWSYGNVWLKSPFEDVTLEVLLNDGTILSDPVDFSVEYTGAEVVLGDIAGATVNEGPNGTIDLVDWLKFRSGVGTDVSSLSMAQAYQAGDLNADFAVDNRDYTTFVAVYNGANGSGAFAAALASVPEPSSVALIVLGVGLAWGAGARRRQPATSDRDKKPVVHKYARGTMKNGLMMLAALATTCFVFMNTSLAVSDFVVGNYDADAGNPANAEAIQNPEVQGWTEWASGAQGQDPNVATLADGESLSLGVSFDNSVFGEGEDGDLAFTLTDLQGRSVLSTLFDTVSHVTGSTTVPGDYDNSGMVEQGDLDLVLLNWGSATTPPGWINDPPPGPIGGTELSVVKTTWGNTFAVPTSAAVPEPAAGFLSLILLAVLGLFARQGVLHRSVVLSLALIERKV